MKEELPNDDAAFEVPAGDIAHALFADLICKVCEQLVPTGKRGREEALECEHERVPNLPS